MATAKTCDRCGKVMKLNDYELSDVQLTRNQYFMGFIKKRIEHFDLCDSCVIEFMKFLENKFA